jgi:glycosyltransferase involved in cell wall biosynthesis
MDILFIGKRFYTNRDAYKEKFGRIYQLPYYWSKEIDTHLWLVDYHSKEKIKAQDEKLDILSTPIISFLFIYTFIKLFLKQPKIIVASGDCYIGLLGFILSKLTSSKFIFDVYDKYNTFSGYRNLLGINIYDFLLKKSDICLFASQKLRNDTKELCKKSIIVPNGIDLRNFHPRDKALSREMFNLDQNDLYIGYFGSMEIERGIDDLIEAVQIVQNDGVNLKILLAGKKRKNINLNYDFIHYLGNIEFKNVPNTMACCDLLALPYRNSEFLDNASSCKIAEYLAMRVPIVATFSHNLVQNFNIEKEEIELLAEKNNPNDYAKKLIKILKENILFKCEVDIHTWNNISSESLIFIYHSLDHLKK